MNDDPFPPVMCTYDDLRELERRWHAFPDLLAACEAALPHLVNEPAADAVRAAIDKATGVSQEQGQ